MTEIHIHTQTSSEIQSLEKILRLQTELNKEYLRFKQQLEAENPLKKKEIEIEELKAQTAAQAEQRRNTGTHW